MVNYDFEPEDELLNKEIYYRLKDYLKRAKENKDKEYIEELKNLIKEYEEKVFIEEL